MKKPVLSLMLLMSIFWTDVAHAVSNNDQIPLIIIDDTRTGTSTTRRTLALIPLECYYDSIFNEVIVSFLEPLGYVDISLVNISTGETYPTIMTSSDNGQYTIPLSGESGCYFISFYYHNGKCYVGEFEL